MAMPITTPATTDMTSPIAQASKVSLERRPERRRFISLNSATMMAENGGR